MYFMKKINLKFLSGMLSFVTLFPTAAVQGLDYSKVGYNVYPVERVEDSIDIKSIAGIGVSGLLTAGMIKGICEAAKDRSPFVAHNYSKLPNANFTNTANLCFWHALVQQLYDIKAFRKFINSVNLDTVTCGLDQKELQQDDNKQLVKITRRQIRKFRELFANMARYGGENYSRFTKYASYNMAKEFLPSDQVGKQQDISEACNNFLTGVFDEYAKFCGRPQVGRMGKPVPVTNIVMAAIPLVQRQNLKLGDLLKENEANYRDKLYAMGSIWDDTTASPNRANRENRMAILRRLPITAFLAKDQQDDIVFNNSAFVIDDKYKHLVHEATPAEPNNCSMETFSGLPRRFQNNVIQGFEKDPVKPYILSNTAKLQQIQADWDSSDSGKRNKARKNLLENLPIGRFLVKDAKGADGKRAGFHLNLPALEAFINGGGTFDQAVRLLKQSTRYKTPLVKNTLGALPASDVDINVLDDQFSIFAGRFQYDLIAGILNKVNTRIDFGGGTVDYKGQE